MKNCRQSPSTKMENRTFVNDTDHFVVKLQRSEAATNRTIIAWIYGCRIRIRMNWNVSFRNCPAFWSERTQSLK